MTRHARPYARSKSPASAGGCGRASNHHPSTHPLTSDHVAGVQRYDLLKPNGHYVWHLLAGGLRLTLALAAGTPLACRSASRGGVGRRRPLAAPDAQPLVQAHARGRLLAVDVEAGGLAAGGRGEGGVPCKRSHTCVRMCVRPVTRRDGWWVGRTRNQPNSCGLCTHHQRHTCPAIASRAAAESLAALPPTHTHTCASAAIST